MRQDNGYRTTSDKDISMSQSQDQTPDGLPKVEAADNKSTYEKITGPFGIEPKHLFLVASAPLCMGAYSGFRKQIKHAERQAKRAAKRKAAGKPPLRLTADSRAIGARALGVATMMSCGGFAFLGAGECKQETLYTIGCVIWS
jgi:hypothetical protein